jgi:hypothetical protein
MRLILRFLMPSNRGAARVALGKAKPQILISRQSRSAVNKASYVSLKKKKQKTKKQKTKNQKPKNKNKKPKNQTPALALNLPSLLNA